MSSASATIFVRPIARLLYTSRTNPPIASTSTHLKMELPIVTDLMDAWTTESFNTPLIRKKIEVPRITKPDQLLLKVEASSLNPIDVRLTEGYGDEVLSKWSQLESSNYNPLSLCSAEKFGRLPLITGRDFSARVVAVGSNVKTYIPGDEVIGVIPVHWQGAHAEYCVAPVYGVAKKPLSVSHVEATTMPYAACTAWNALVTLLKAWGVPKIVATCSDKNCEMVENLGAKAIDYNSTTAKEQIIDEGPFEVILDCADSELARWSDQIMGVWRNCVHVSLVSPLLADTDRYGAPMGLATSLVKMFCRSYKSAIHGRWNAYAFFVPNSDCLDQISLLIDQQKIKPVVEKVYSFSDVPEAYAQAGKGHTRGK
uniref:Enoyl reductase (ER) domain-containing protein n=1 Tax=Ditylenchus dipsaci TaxID=166011 RepID=A0A915DN07_9BILA